MNESSPTWPHSSDVVVLVNPAKRMAIARHFMIALVCLAATAVAFAADGPVVQLAKWLTNDGEQEARFDASMRHLAQSGKADAVIWAALTSPGSSDAQLRVLASRGNTIAMLALADLARRRGEVAEAKEWLGQAALAGHPDAVRWQLSEAQE